MITFINNLKVLVKFLAVSYFDGEVTSSNNSELNNWNSYFEKATPDEKKEMIDSLKKTLNSLNKNKNLNISKDIDNLDDSEIITFNNIIDFASLDSTKDSYLIEELFNALDSMLLEKTEIQEEASLESKWLKEQVDRNWAIFDRLIKLDTVVLTYISELESFDKNQSNEVMAFQQTFHDMWFDISFKTKSGAIKRGEHAIDGIAGSTFTRVVWELQDLLWVEKTGDLNESTLFAFKDYVNKELHNREITNNKITKNIPLVSDKPTWESIETWEKAQDIDITFGFWSEEWKDIRSNINSESFDEMINNISFSELSTLYSEFERILIEKNYDEKSSKFEFWLFNGDIKDLLKSYWYNPDWWLAWIEVSSLLSLLTAAYETQKKVQSATSIDDEMKALLFDYNKDWVVDDNIRYTREIEFMKLVDSDLKMSNLLSNLWYDSTEKFLDEFKSGFYGTREYFQEALYRILSQKYPLDPMDLINNPNALKDFNVEKVKLGENIKDIVETHPATNDLSPEWKKDVTKWILWLSVWYAKWVWVSIDISEFTNNILDNVSIWLINWTPWISLSKNFKLHERFWTTVWWALTPWGFVAFVWASFKFFNSDIEPKELLPKDFESNPNISIVAAQIWVFTAVWLDFELIKKWTKAGIEKVCKEMWETLREIVPQINEWKAFEELGIEDNSKNIRVYNDIKRALAWNGWNTELLIEGILRAYKDTLYVNADKWIHLSNLWIGAIWWIVPYVNASFESHNVEHKQVNTYSKYESKQVAHDVLWDIPELLTMLQKYKSKFDYKTRYMTWAKDLMDPNSILDVKLNWLENILWRLFQWENNSDFDEIFKIIHSNWRISEKKALVSTFVQYMRKANDFDNGNMDSWNSTKINDFIKTEDNRRWAYNTEFWFNTDELYKEFKTKIQEWTWKLWEKTVQGMWFDAVSSINVEGKSGEAGRVSGMDVLYTNLSMFTVDGEVLTVQVTKRNQIESFLWKLSQKEWFSPEKLDELKEKLLNGQMQLHFYKDPLWFDDRMMLTDTQWRIAVFGQENETTKISILWTHKDSDEKKEIKDPEWDNKVETTPWADAWWKVETPTNPDGSPVTAEPSPNWTDNIWDSNSTWWFTPGWN